MKKTRLRIHQIIAIMLLSAIILPILGVKLIGGNKEDSPFVAYAALNNRLTTLGGTRVSKDTESLEETIREAKEKQKRLEAEKQKLEKENAILQSDYDKLSEYIGVIDNKQSEIAEAIVSVNMEILNTEAELVVVQEQLEEAKQIADQQYENMKTRIQYIYENGNYGYLDLLLNAKSLSSLLNQVEYIQKISNYDRALFNKYIEARNEVQDKEQFLEAKKASLEVSKEQYLLDLEFVDKLAAEKKAAMDEAAEKLGTNAEILGMYLADIEAQKITVKQAEKEQAELIKKQEEERKRQEELLRLTVTPTPKPTEAVSTEGNPDSGEKPTPKPTESAVPHTGTESVLGIEQTDKTNLADAIWPYPGCNDLGSGFGPRIPPIAGASSFHKGQDIGGTVGDPIVAILAGKVMFSGGISSVDPGGLHIYIDHGNGVISRYLHLSVLNVKTGDYVKQGQIIGYCGNTGTATTGAHLHFSIFVNGEAQDPLRYIAY